MSKLPTHDNCGGKLAQPRVAYKDDDGNLVNEFTDNYRFCVRCRKMVQIEVIQQ